MFKSLPIKLRLSNLLVERGVKIVYTILNLYLGANFFIPKEFLILQQITLFQSFLLFAIALPVPAILLRLGNTSLEYFKTLILSTVILRTVIGTIAIIIFSTYLIFTGTDLNDVSLISLGLLPVFITSVLFIEILPHVFNFEGRKNWELIIILAIFFIVKCFVIIFFKSISIKIFIEIIEAIIIVAWNFSTYLRRVLKSSSLKSSFQRVSKLVKSSAGLYFNGILSVFILRIDQFALIKLVDKSTLSNYMLIVSISSLFLIPMSLLGERLSFTMNIAKSKSMANFKSESYRALFLFLIYSVLLYLIYAVLFNQISTILFKRNLTDLHAVGLVLGVSIISNSIGMVLGQINSILNGGIYTMKRSLAGCIFMFIGVNLGYRYFSILGVATAAAGTLFLTNVLFWFFSKKIRLILLK